MTGCLPQDSSHCPSSVHYSFTSQPSCRGTASAGQQEDRQQLCSVHSAPDIPTLADPQPHSQAVHRLNRIDQAPLQTSCTPVSSDLVGQSAIHHHHHHHHLPDTAVQQPGQPGQVTLDHSQSDPARPPPTPNTVSEAAGQQQALTAEAHGTDSVQQGRSVYPLQTVVSQIQFSSQAAHSPQRVVSQIQSSSQASHSPQPWCQIPSHHHSSKTQRQHPETVSPLHDIAGSVNSPGKSSSQDASPQPCAQCAACLQAFRSGGLCPLLAGPAHRGSRQTQGVLGCHHQGRTTSPAVQPPPLSPAVCSPSTMLDKKLTLQVITTDHSPVSPGSSASSPRFIFPDTHSSPSSSLLASDSTSSPFMSPVKREVKWEAGTPPQSTYLESIMQQVDRDGHRVHSGDTETSGAPLDSETGSSVLEDSSSSREQSPFSTMSFRSSSELSLSPLASRSMKQHTVAKTSEEEQQGEETEGRGASHSSSSHQHDNDFHPSKFKRRLHERYILSQKDACEMPCRIKQECVDKYEYPEVDMVQDSKHTVTKVERPDSPWCSNSPVPKSPCPSWLDMGQIEPGASSADEGDVFMEPSESHTKPRPTSLHQKEPLDLSRGPAHSSFRSSSSSSPHIDPGHLSPASKMFSPLFRSPHRLPYSPHGLLSPQSQSPLCSVPEGGRIFNFNMPSPLEDVHSDSDLISPSPVSPRIFTFPPQGAFLHSMSDVNHLAVSPRAPYTPPPSFLRGKPRSGAGVPHSPKWGNSLGFCSKRSLSDSDMTYLCPVCGQVFPSNDSLAKHMAKHLPTETVRAGDSKVHYCKICNRSFSRSDMLTRHMRLHTGLKPYECMDCGQVFSRSDHLNTHRRTHTGEKPYHCPHCPYAACRRDMITRHMRTHAKRASRRSRYLSVPEDGDSHKPSGSVSSIEMTDSQNCSVGGPSCSVSSVDSVDSESLHASRVPDLATSVDSLLSSDQDSHFTGRHSSPKNRKPSADLEKGREGAVVWEEGLSSDRFMQYRKGRHWSTASLESVNSEEAVMIREVLADNAFHDFDSCTAGFGEGVGGEDGGEKENKVATSPTQPTDMAGLESKTLHKCFISFQAPGSSSS